MPPVTEGATQHVCAGLSDRGSRDVGGNDGRVSDALFDDLRLAGVYDALHPDRSDLDAYIAIIDEVHASSVLDVGCGTGTFACRLAAGGLAVVGVDPALASLDVARGKPHADRVRWIHGDATMLPPLAVDAAVMTGNVAQVFITDDEWLATLAGTHARASPGWSVGVRESRAGEASVGAVDARAHPHDGGRRRHRNRRVLGDLLAVDGDLVTFRSVTRLHRDGLEIESRSTLRFRDRTELLASLDATGYDIVDVRDAPDRPGLENVFIADRR